MNFVINEMNKVNAEEISHWKYEEPYSMYSMNSSEEQVNEFMNGSYYSVYKNNELVGYFCFGESAQVPIGNKVNAYDDRTFLDIGLGLKPELCGNGYGLGFLESGLNFASNKFSKDKVRLTVARFNQRAIKVYRKVGFKKNNLSFIKKGGENDIEFIVMILEDRTDVR